MFTEPTIGNITIFAGSFAPQYWLFCQGQLLSIAENTALYTVIGTTYGGDGELTFALPDLRGRAAIGAGQAPRMQTYIVGEPGGAEGVVLTGAQVSGHSHTVTNVSMPAPPASNLPGTVDTPAGNVPALVNGAPAQYNTTNSANNLGNSVSSGVTELAGSDSPQPMATISPYLAMNYIICVAGIYPSRS